MASFRALWHRPAVWVALFGLCLYLITTGAYLDSPDGQSMYTVTAGIALRGDIRVPDTERLDTLFEKPGRDGGYYSKYGLGQPLAQLPLFLIGDAVGPGGSQAAVALLHAFTTPLCLLVLYAIARRLFHHEAVAIAIALVYGLATMAWLYATLTYVDPLVTLLLLCICWLLERAERSREVGALLGMAGVLAAVAVLTKYPAVIYIPALLWYAGRCRPGWRGWLLLLAPLLVGALILAGYNFWRYGDIWFTGYHIKELTRLPQPIWYGLYTVLLSPGKSIFIYAPPLLAALAFLPAFIRRHSGFGTLVALLALTSLIFYAPVNPWAGAWSPGPRYHLPVLPLLLLPLGLPLSNWTRLKAWQRMSFVQLCLAGALAQIASVGVSYPDALELIQRAVGGRAEWGFWFFDPDYAPWIWQINLLVAELARLAGLSLGLTADSIAALPDGRSLGALNPWFARARLGGPQGLALTLLIGGLLLAALRLALWLRPAHRSHPVTGIRQGELL